MADKRHAAWRPGAWAWVITKWWGGSAFRMPAIVALSIAASLFVLVTDGSSAADNGRGAQLAATCASCHRLDGSDRGIPSITGLGEDRLMRAMLAYRSSEHPSRIMHAVALSLSDQEIASVARFLAAQDKKGTPP
jgi:sulfide dehydrogenase cytochrome subunit